MAQSPSRNPPQKLLITRLMCAGPWECEINHQPRDELLRWILVSRLPSLVMAFVPSPSGAQVRRCRLFIFPESAAAGGDQATAVPGSCCVSSSQRGVQPPHPPTQTVPRRLRTPDECTCARTHTRQTHPDTRTQPGLGRHDAARGDLDAANEPVLDPDSQCFLPTHVPHL